MKKKLFFLIPIIIVVVVFFGVYGYYNKQDAKNALTVTEKKWVEENKSNVIDFSVINDYPLYGLNGKGVFFNFLKDFEQDVGLEFNKVSYLKEDKISSKGYSFRILDNDTKLSKNDLLLFNDGYIALGREYQRINHIADMKNITFGVLKDDASLTEVEQANALRKEVFGEDQLTAETNVNLEGKDYSRINELK